LINEEKEDVRRGKKARNKAKIFSKNLMEKKEEQRNIFASEKLKEEERE